jgi:hypothetical protein
MPKAHRTTAQLPLQVRERKVRIAVIFIGSEQHRIPLEQWRREHDPVVGQGAGGAP